VALPHDGRGQNSNFTLGRELHGVGHQVLKDLLQSQRVGGDQRVALEGFQPRFKLDPESVSLVLLNLYDFVDGLDDVKLLFFFLEFFLPQAGEI